MESPVMSADLPDWTRRAFSAPRMRPYLEAAGNDGREAVALYWWNVEISAAFYGPLHCLEIVLRNALHGQLAARYGRSDWWAAAPLTEHGVRLVEEAADKCRRRLGRRGRSGPTADDVVAELSFGFWVSLLSNRTGSQYDRLLWVPTLHQAFRPRSGSRAVLHESLETMRLLRNRIMHHEPIHHRDLAADHRRLYQLLNAIDGVVAKEIRVMDRVPFVLARRDAVRSRQAQPWF
ncbi:hypothetical protein [Micromonospora robiginosa]|uniref:Abi-like protein n=1 Tax=Micromonospora robiginosa TaxID=2749844 RepID=A0A7L6BEC2_9ACTN|nr:hypothetical protein [Micromonospora ferruginea]QLQ40303.2 hypothetical protein H1D33_11275 [Micromonospora ferruginea]